MTVITILLCHEISQGIQLIYRQFSGPIIGGGLTSVLDFQASTSVSIKTLCKHNIILLTILFLSDLWRSSTC